MRKLAVVCLFILFAGTGARAQFTMHKIVHAGYVWQNQSFGEVGARLLLLKTDDLVYRVGGAALLGTANGKFAALPKLQGDILFNFEKNVDLYHAYYFLIGGEVTSKYAGPKIGASLFGLFDFTAGYAFPYGAATLNGVQMKGLNFNFTVNVPWVLLHDLTK